MLTTQYLIIKKYFFNFPENREFGHYKVSCVLLSNPSAEDYVSQYTAETCCTAPEITEINHFFVILIHFVQTGGTYFSLSDSEPFIAWRTTIHIYRSLKGKQKSDSSDPSVSFGKWHITTCKACDISWSCSWYTSFLFLQIANYMTLTRMKTVRKSTNLLFWEQERMCKTSNCNF